MFIGRIAYLYQENTIVLNKSNIHRAKDGDFRDIRLFLSNEEINELYEELEFHKGGEINEKSYSKGFTEI